MFEELIGNMTKPGTWLHNSDVRGLIQGHIEHAIKLDHKMAIFSAETKRCITVATALGIDCDAMF